MTAGGRPLSRRRALPEPLSHPVDFIDEADTAVELHRRIGRVRVDQKRSFVQCVGVCEHAGQQLACEALMAEGRARCQVEDLAVRAFVKADDGGGFAAQTSDEEGPAGIQLCTADCHISLYGSGIRLLFAAGKPLQLCN